MFTLKTAIVLAILSALGGVMAGPDANVHGCVYLQQAPLEPFDVTFDPTNSENHCMNKIGESKTVKVTSSGLTCASIGTVESKVSSWGDWCMSAPSIWNLSYNADAEGGHKSGTIKCYWTRGVFRQHSIILNSSPKGSEVCGAKALCSKTEFWWSEDGANAYFIFQLDYSVEKPKSQSDGQVDGQVDSQFVVQQGGGVSGRKVSLRKFS
ncbi:hypothetical protein AX14_002340 [Amanita brunnescens Koide BX004]|nr:hypothetical protein AX14_002340 [Amanita brunnescens Koide BX004]